MNTLLGTKVAILNRSELFNSSKVLVPIVGASIFIAYKIVNIPIQLELVLLVSAALLYPILCKPSTGVYLVFSTMPFIPHVRRLYYLVYSRPAVDPLIVFGYILIAISLMSLFFVFREHRIVGVKMDTIQKSIILYLVYIFFRVFYLNDLDTMEALFRFTFYGPAVLLFFLGTYYAHRIVLLKRILVITVIIGTFASLYGFKQLMVGYSEAEKLWFSSISFSSLFIKGLARPFSFFQSPASFADYMQLSIIGVFVLYGMSTTSRKFLFLAFIPLFFGGALITSVRSNWIGLAISLFLWIVLFQLREGHKKILVLAVLCFVFVIIRSTDISETTIAGTNRSFPFQQNDRGGNHLTLLVTERSGALTNPFEEHSFLSRLHLWKFIIALSFDPIMGVFGRGTGCLNADSLYITYLAEFGYPGIIFILWLTSMLIIKGISFSPSNNSLNEVALVKAITVMNIVFAIVNITGSHIHSIPGDCFFWFWNGVLIGITAKSIPRNNIPRKVS